MFVVCPPCFLNRGHSGSNVSHIVILRPLKSGYFNFTSADISYMASDESEEPQVGSWGWGGGAGRVIEKLLIFCGSKKS